MARILVYSAALFVVLTASAAQAAIVGYQLDYRGDLVDDVNWSVLQLTNNSDSARLVRVELTIGDSTFNWDASNFYD